MAVAHDGGIDRLSWLETVCHKKCRYIEKTQERLMLAPSVGTSESTATMTIVRENGNCSSPATKRVCNPF